MSASDHAAMRSATDIERSRDMSPPIRTVARPIAKAAVKTSYNHPRKEAGEINLRRCPSRHRQAMNCDRGKIAEQIPGRIDKKRESDFNPTMDIAESLSERDRRARRHA
jgi:hypothetical protein